MSKNKSKHEITFTNDKKLIKITECSICGKMFRGGSDYCLKCLKKMIGDIKNA